MVIMTKERKKKMNTVNGVGWSASENKGGTIWVVCTGPVSFFQMLELLTSAWREPRPSRAEKGSLK